MFYLGNAQIFDQMKNALSLACMLLAGILLSTSGFSQNSAPYNPDGNGDGMIGVTDLQDFLSTYGLAFEATASTWSCGESMTYAGVDYSTVQIGDHCWFAENLRTTTYLNGEAIPQNLSDGDWVSTTSGAMAFYQNDFTYQVAYGGLYNWYAVDDARGLCPSSWHVPTDAEWTILTDHLGGESVAGGQMKSNYGWVAGGNGTNSSGFSGLPGGLRYFNGGYFYAAGYLGGWWSSSPFGSNAWDRFLSSNGENVDRDYGSPHFGFSVRCVRDAE
jgi:uncharacterized protein (TIGR02145 family)